mgnify:CR=1 FL=1
MSGWLEGKRALVVGAGSGIGRAVVDAFRAEGAQVAVLERDEAKCEKLAAEIPGLPVVVGDATTREANEEAVAAAVEAFGGLDVLVNCVGVFDFYRGVGELDADRIDDAFDEIFRVNVKSHLHSVKAALPALRESRGSILLTESILLDNMNPATRVKVGFDWGIPAWINLIGDAEYAFNKTISVHGGVRNRYSGWKAPPKIRRAYPNASELERHPGRRLWSWPYNLVFSRSN